MSVEPIHSVDTTDLDLELAIALGLKITAECGALFVPRKIGKETAGLPWCPTCHPRSARRSQGNHRYTAEQRREFPHYVYRCYDARGRLLYVGCTYNPESRFRQHRAEKRVWVDQLASTRLTVWPNRRKALDMERLAIETEAPLFNKAFNRRAS